jgi:hypothetical protein
MNNKIDHSRKFLPGDAEDCRLPHVMQRQEEGLSGKCYGVEVQPSDYFLVEIHFQA